jgi:hypothetical protein
MYRLRLWSVRRARLLERLYHTFERTLFRLDPLWRLIGDRASARALRTVEKPLKQALFDCRMCGQCILGDTGMSCPMNCPKQLRNGPCGGVRADGGCEVVPEMRCVWVEAWDGSRRMAKGDRIMEVQPPVDHRRLGDSSWLEVLDEHRGERRP